MECILRLDDILEEMVSDFFYLGRIIQKFKDKKKMPIMKIPFFICSPLHILSFLL